MPLTIEELEKIRNADQPLSEDLCTQYLTVIEETPKDFFKLNDKTTLGDLNRLNNSIDRSYHPADDSKTFKNFILQHTQARYFNQLKIPMIAVTTDLKTGETYVLDSGPIAPAINASAALAPVFRPVNLYGHTFVDGGFTDLVPVDIARRYQPKMIIAVNIAPNIPTGMPSNIIGVYNRAYALGDDRFVKYNTEGADIVLHPHVGQAGTFDSGDKRMLLLAGENAARQALPQICAMLKAKHIPSKCS